jgi:ankyrin repeat protein
MRHRKTPIDKVTSRLRNNPVIASAIALGTIVIALSTFTNSAKSLLGLIPKLAPTPEDARVELSRIPLEYTPDAFVESARRGDVSAVKLFLAAGMSPNATDDETNTAMMYAARAQPPDETASPEEAKAAHAHYAEIIKALLTAKADVNKRNGWGGTALSWAAAWGNIDALRLLLDAGADAAAVNAAFVDAAEDGHTDILRVLVDRKADVRKMGSEALGSAAGSPIGRVTDGQLSDTVRFLLDIGVDVNASNKEGWTALLLAAEKGYSSVARVLLDRGANIEAKCDCPSWDGGGWTALMIAIKLGHNEVMQLLLDKGANVNAKNHNTGETALITAAGHDASTTVTALLDKGAEVNAKTVEGETALIAAAGRAASTTVTALLDKGAEVNAKTVEGETALMAAARYGRPDVVRELLRRGAAPNDKNRHGETALALAQQRWTAGRSDEDLQNEAAEVVRALKLAGGH